MYIQIRIRGITPLICNRFHDEAADAATSGKRAVTIAGSRGTPLEQAEKKLYRNIEGVPTIPSPNLLRCIYDGGRFHKAGKKQITTATESMLCSVIAITSADIVIESSEPWRVDTRAVVIPTTKGRILAHRPLFDNWSLAFEVFMEEGLLDSKLFRQIVDDAGNRIGLGDFRPARKGPYGRFVVTEWHEVPADLRIAA